MDVLMILQWHDHPAFDGQGRKRVKDLMQDGTKIETDRKYTDCWRRLFQFLLP